MSVHKDFTFLLLNNLGQEYTDSRWSLPAKVFSVVCRLKQVSMKAIISVFVSLCVLVSVRAQKPTISNEGTVTINRGKTKFTFVPYASNVIKVIAEPSDYKTNEMISDAVITKPQKTRPAIGGSSNGVYTIRWGKMNMQLKGDSIFFGSKRNGFIASVDTAGENKTFRFRLTAEEKIFGAGERALPLDRRGYRLNLYNNPWYAYGVGADNLNYSVPFITSSNNYALFFDNPSKGYLDVGKTNQDVLEYGTMSGQLNFYLITGNTYPEILSSYHLLTGTQPIPPRWALGNFLSRFGYTSEKEVKDIMQKMKSESIPYDAVIFDLFWFGDSIKGTLGNLEWVNKNAWPVPARMINDFAKEGTKTVLITEPFVLQQSLNYNNSKQYHAVDSTGNPYVLTDFYFGRGGLIDIFRKDSRDWFWSKYKVQMNNGVEGWWGDLGEPEKHPSNLYHNLRDLGFSKRLFKADEVHNIYGHYWTKMISEKYAKEYPNKRLFSLNRSGFAGTQRYNIFPWTGDVSRSWSGYQAQLPVLLGMSMSGVPYVHSDAGGFAGGEKDPELYVRWLQFAAYTPIFKPHGTELSAIDTTVPNYPSEPALFPEPYKSYAKKVVEERYALMPYNYTLAYQQSVAGRPLISPLYYYFSSDTVAARTEDEFMWGQNILVAPVLQKGSTSRSIYLPKGGWYNYRSNARQTGGQTVTESADLTTIPVFVREGSFIPKLTMAIPNTSKYSTADLSVTYYPAAKSSDYTLFDDDGSTNGSVIKGKFELIKMHGNGWNNGGKITFASNGGTFAGRPAKRHIVLTIPGAARATSSVLINGKVLTKSAKGNNYFVRNSETNNLDIHFTFSGSKTSIEVK